MTEAAAIYNSHEAGNIATPILRVQLSVQHGDSDNRFQFLPERKTDGSAGYDVRADIPASLEIAPGQSHLVPLGFCAAITAGYFAQMSIRSGIALKRGLMLANGVAIIDSDYRDEWKAIIVNTGIVASTIAPGERIAQFVIQPYLAAKVEMVPHLESTGRRGGFGSTGVR